jgi:hypothetical protein
MTALLAEWRILSQSLEFGNEIKDKPRFEVLKNYAGVQTLV